MPALRFNEGRSCDAVLRVLEARAGSGRVGLRCPDNERHRHPVEAVCTIGNQLYAVEHTGLEPFDGHIKLSAQAEFRIDPLVSRVSGRLPPNEEFELVVPVDAIMTIQPRDLPAVHTALAEWIVQTAPTLPIAPMGRYLPTQSAMVAGVPFPVRLYRGEPVLPPGVLRLNLSLAGHDEKRQECVRKALAEKCGKLAGWKTDHQARTVLVLEQVDIQLMNPHLVTEALLLAEQSAAESPDEVYLVMTCLDRWAVFPLRVGQTTYFDLRLPESRRMEFDASSLTDITGRDPASAARAS